LVGIGGEEKDGAGNEDGTGGWLSPIALPHARQNCAVGETAAPQCGHWRSAGGTAELGAGGWSTAMGLPHALQNCASAEIGAPQCLQNFVCSLIYLSPAFRDRQSNRASIARLLSRNHTKK
jgi:hypothetical protein